MIEDIILGMLPSTLPCNIGDLPGVKRNNICIMLFDGNPNTEYFQSTGADTVYEPLIKIVVRNSSYEQGKQWVDQVKEALHRQTAANLLGATLVGSPMYLGRSDQKLHEFQITFRILTIEE